MRDQATTADYVRRGFELADRSSEPLPLLLRGTNFQIKVWEALLRIPFGHVVSYQAIARRWASRAPYGRSAPRSGATTSRG